jgi:hypothetical protein
MTSSALGIDPLLGVALALHNTRGGYALLLGSGLSSAAGIPTGWGIVEDLIRRVAAAESEEARRAADADPAAWYRARYREEPQYSDLIARLAPSRAERRQLLRAYFEPTDDEREEGRKLPTAAHRAVARLMRDGIVRVVLTTNFDRLLETALGELGVAPAIIATADQVRGMMPLHLEPATLIKLHGDYLDTRIRNTPEELASYPRLLNRLLDRVLDEYGLVVCGWSATWDPALRDAITRSPARRFTTFWAARGEVSEEARAIIDQRRAQEIEIEGADEFLDAVVEKVATLESFQRPHPLTTAVAVATLKRYLPVPEQRIRLHDLVMDEVTRVSERVPALIVPGVRPEPLSVVKDVMTRVEATCETLIALMTTGAYWGEERHRSLWVEVLERLGNHASFGNFMGGTFYQVWVELYRYPAMLAFFAAGLAALARGKSAEETVADLLVIPRIKFRRDSASDSAAEGLYAMKLMDHGTAQAVLHPNAYTPVSDHLYEILQPAIRPLVADDEAYATLFDRWEYLIALAYSDQNVTNPSDRFFVPVGRLVWRREMLGNRPSASEVVRLEVQREGPNWFLLRRGLFGGSPLRLSEHQAGIDGALQRRGYW